MIDRRKKRMLLFSACVVLFVSAAVSYSHSARVYGRLFRSGGGWGYDIVYNGKAVIHQPYIPALPGMNPFPDRHSARKVASHVAARVQSGESPAVSAEEVRELMHL